MRCVFVALTCLALSAGCSSERTTARESGEGSAASATDRVELIIKSKPSGADVRRGSPTGELLGTTPLRTTVVKTTGSVSYWLTKDGHQPTELSVDGQDTVVELVSLPVQSDDG